MITPEARPGRDYGITGRFEDVSAYQIANDFGHALNRLSAALADVQYPDGRVPGAPVETAATEEARKLFSEARLIRGPVETRTLSRATLYERVLAAVGRLETMRAGRDSQPV